ncbi:MAG: DUF1848 domain-containing protein [Nitrospinae bacterium]|nr:DUF1848 domain-containing protein [Nitrospinota bacterium]
MPVISASRRTDIPAIYGAWFMDKIEKGECRVMNPFSGKVDTVSLKLSDVDGIVFWSRNYRPMIENLKRLHDMGYRFYCQFTINGYPRFLERSSPAVSLAVKTAHELCGLFGPKTVVWRYDPIILTSATDYEWHMKNISMIADGLNGATDACVMSFVDWYRKVDRNLNPVLQSRGLTADNPSAGEMKAFAIAMGDVARSRGLRIAACCEPDVEGHEIPRASCVDSVRLSQVTGKDLRRLPPAPTRAGCGCRASRDIGAYDTCPLGCAYCYASRSREISLAKMKGTKREDMSLGGRTVEK